MPEALCEKCLKEERQLNQLMAQGPEALGAAQESLKDLECAICLEKVAKAERINCRKCGLDAVEFVEVEGNIPDRRGLEVLAKRQSDVEIVERAKKRARLEEKEDDFWFPDWARSSAQQEKKKKRSSRASPERSGNAGEECSLHPKKRM